MTLRRRRDSSLSASVDRETGSSDRVPQLGAIVRGIVSKITSFGAFVKVPGYLDGLIHISRMAERPLSEQEAREIVRENEAIFAKVILVGPGRYSLDIRFVDQEEGTDLDPSNGRRIQLEPAIAKGVYEEVKPSMESSRKSDETSVAVNKIYSAVIIKELKYGVFVKAGNQTGLLPQAKIGKTCSGRFGEKVYVKIVEVQSNGKFNCDARYVDQRTGSDLDPENLHSNEKLTFDGVIIPPEEFNKEAPPRDRQARRDRSESVVRRSNRREEDDSVNRSRHGRRDDDEIVKKGRDEVVRRPGRDDDDVVRRNRDDVVRRPRHGDEEDVIKRPRRSRSRDDVVRRPGRGDDDVIRRDRDDVVRRPVRRDEEDVIKRPRRSRSRDDVVRRPGRRDDDEIIRRPKRSPSRDEVVRRPNRSDSRRSRSRSEEIIIRRR